MRINFVLIAEGSSDRAMVSHLRKLCLSAGADDVKGTALDFNHLHAMGNSLLDKLRVAITRETSANMFFLHRDADSRDHGPRHREIQAAIDASDPQVPCVAVVPVQETEAWLLLDEMAIRRVVENSEGRVPLNLPAPSAVERLANPKELLQKKLILACKHTGRQLERFKSQFGLHRHTLLDELPVGGPLENLPAWTRLRDDIRKAIASKATKKLSD